MCESHGNHFAVARGMNIEGFCLELQRRRIGWAKYGLIALLAIGGGVACARADETDTIGTKVADFQAITAAGKSFRLSDLKNQRAIAFLFIGVECPIAKLYSERIQEISAQYADDLRIILVDSNHRDSVQQILSWKKLHGLDQTVLYDPRQLIADHLSATRNPEVILLDHESVIRYRGRIDDQYTTTRRSSAAIHEDFVVALDQVLAEQEVTTPVTVATGCYIDRAPKTSISDEPNTLFTYHQHIAPIIRRRCASCHREGQSAPFELLTFQQARSWIDTIEEVVIEKRMPPWFANPKHGKFANSGGLTQKERTQLLGWIAADGPEGDSNTAAPLDPLPEDEWNIGTPDAVISIPEPQKIPATGVLEYRYVIVDTGFEEDVWVQAAEVRPTTPAVVHHCNVWPQTETQQSFTEAGKEIDWNSAYLAVTAPGRPPMTFPSGMAKRIPAGAKLVFQLHYQTIGREVVDQTRIGLRFVNATEVDREVVTHGLLAGDEELTIRAGDENHQVLLERKIESDLLLLAMAPHMHLRGRSCRYEARYPDGRTEILLDIPHWDFNWQDRYELAEPKRLPAGTTMVAKATFDNSSNNPYNPDPTATVHFGPQSTDEMFNAWYEAVLEDHDVSELKKKTVRTTTTNVLALIAAALVMVMGAIRLKADPSNRR